MKKSSILLVALTILPFSTSRCMDNNPIKIIGGLAILGSGIGIYWYYNHYKPAHENTNTPNANTPLNIPDNNIPDNNIPNIMDLDQKTNIHPDITKIIDLAQNAEKNKPFIIKVSLPKQTKEENPTAETGFLTNVRDSIKKLDLEILLENNVLGD